MERAHRFVGLGTFGMLRAFSVHDKGNTKEKREQEIRGWKGELYDEGQDKPTQTPEKGAPANPSG